MALSSTVGRAGNTSFQENTTISGGVQCAPESACIGPTADAGGVARRGRPVGSGGPLCLSPAHISPLRSGVVECWDGGHLVTVTKPGVRERVGGGIRGRCEAFSKASRRRMLREMAKVRNDASALFLTLTYPAEWPTEWGRWKRDLDVFCRRLHRKFPTVGVVWKLEPQVRGAPHFHLLLFGVDFIPKGWVKRAWFEVVGSGDELHLKHGAHIDRVRDARGIRSYASKYLGKVPLPDLLAVSGVDWSQVGRWWGVRYPDNIPWADCLRLHVNDRQAAKVLRVLRHYLERVAGIRVRPGLVSLSAFYDGALFASALPRLL